MKQHPTDTELVAFCEAETPAGAETSVSSESAAVQQHLAECTACEDRVRSLRALFRASREWTLVDTPEQWIEVAVARVRELLADAPDAPRSDSLGERIREAARSFASDVQTVVAHLVLDSAQGAHLQGIRGGTALVPRQLMYESSLGTIHLQIEPKKPRQLEILGQFLPTAGTLGSDPDRVVLDDGTHRVSRKLPASGEFHFRSVRPGPVRLRFEMGNQVVELEPIQLGADEEL